MEFKFTIFIEKHFEYKVIPNRKKSSLVQLELPMKKNVKQAIKILDCFSILIDELNFQLIDERELKFVFKKPFWRRDEKAPVQ